LEGCGSFEVELLACEYGLTSFLFCRNGLVLCDGHAFREYCVRSEANFCVVANVLVCLPVAHVRPSRSGALLWLDGCKEGLDGKVTATITAITPS
jgi:hypothetical protein